MPAATAIAPNAVPGANKSGAPNPVQAGGEGAGDLFAVLVGMVGEDKPTQAQSAQTPRPPARAKDSAPAEAGGADPAVEADKPDEETAQAALTDAAPAQPPAVPVAQAPPAAAPAPQVVAANDFNPSASPPPAPQPSAPADLAALADAAPVPSAPANDVAAPAVPETLTAAPEAPAAPQQAAAPPAGPVVARNQAAAPAAPADAPPAPVPAAPAPPAQAVASAPPAQPAVEAPPATEPPPSIAATVAGAVQQAAAPGAGVAAKPATGEGRSKPGDTAAPSDPAPGPRVAASGTASTLAIAPEGEALADGDADFAMMDGETGQPAAADPDDGSAPPAPAPQAPASFAATSQGAGGTVGAGTVSHLAAQMLSKLDGKATRFEIQLDPLGLGKVNVSVHIDARGRLSAAMTFDNPDSAEALKARSGDLRQALERAGFDLSGGGLSFEADLGAGFAGGRWGDGGESNPHNRGRAFGAAAEAADLADQTPARADRRAARGLDIRI